MSQNVGSSFPNLNPLGYAGSNKTNPPQLHIMKRAPTTADVIPYAIGDEWLDTSASPNVWYKLCDKKQGVGTWLLITANSTSINEIQADSGSALPVNGVVKSKGAAPISTSASGDTLTTSLETPLKAIYGGTGNASIPTNGQVPIGDGTKYVPATLTAGTGITITNGAGSVTIANSGVIQEAIQTINSIYPDILKNFQIEAGGGITITPGTNKITISSTTGSGGFEITQEIFQTSGTKTFSSGTVCAIVELVGGGGGSGGFDFQTWLGPFSAFNFTGSGAGGGYAKKTIQNPSSFSYTVGAGGAAGIAGATPAVSSGGDGGTTSVSFDASFYATGGGGGSYIPFPGAGSPSRPYGIINGVPGKGYGGTDVIKAGGFFTDISFGEPTSIAGGSSFYGTGYILRADSYPFQSDGKEGYGLGAGGCSGICYQGASPFVSHVGAKGTDGAVIITSFRLTGNAGSGIARLSFDSGTATPDIYGNISVSGGTGIKTQGSGNASSISIDSPLKAIYGGTGTTAAPSDGQILFGSGGSYVTGTLTAGQNVSITPSAGTETIALAGAINPANGGLGTTAAPGDGNIPIGSSATGKYAPATLTAGSGIAITNGPGSVTISSAANLIKTINATPPSGTGDFTIAAGSALKTTAGIASTTIDVQAPLTAAYGGTGSVSIPANGQIPIGNGTKYVPATLTAGTGISIANGAGSVTISSTGGGSGIQTINSISPSAGNFSINAGSGITVTPGTNAISVGIDAPLQPSLGGTGTALIPSDGHIPIGSGGTYTPASLTGSSYIAITNAPGSSTISLTGTIPVNRGGSGRANTVPYAIIAGGASTTSSNVSIPTGTAGQFLGSNGSAALPTWKTVSYINAIYVQTFTSSGSYTPTAGTKYIVVEILGGGGAGGGTVQTWPSLTLCVGGGGGAGEYNRGTFPIGTITPPISITIGALGTGVAGATGNGGGASYFGIYIAGAGGSGGNVSTTVPAAGSGGVGGSGSSTVDIRCNGQPGETGFFSGNLGVSGRGGNSFYGVGGYQVTLVNTGASTGASSDGYTGYNYGAGGSGAISFYAGTVQTPKQGGNGRAGVCIITEYLSI